MIKQQLFIGAALIAGAGIGFCIAPREQAVKAPVAGEAPVAPLSIEDKGESASVEALRRRLKGLEEELAALRAAPPAAATNQAEAVKSAEDGKRADGPNRFREMMEKLKKDDPERFKRISERMENFRRMREERQKAKLDFLSSVDVSGMGEDAVKTHEELKDLIARRQKLEAELMSEDISDERRREVMGELFSIGGKARELNRRERENLLGAVAKAVGLEGETATELVEAVKDIVESTEESWMPHRGHRGRGRGE